MKLQIHLLVLYSLCPKLQTLPLSQGLNMSAFPILPVPSYTQKGEPPFQLPSFSSSFQYLPTQIFPSQTSHQPTCELLKLPSLFSTSFPYFCPVFPPTLVTSFLSLQFPLLLWLFASSCSCWLYVAVIPAAFC